VLNRDVLELDGLGPFDLIVAVSTLEHVGWDERPRQPAKAVSAAHALLGKLAPGGRLFLTVPAGYNPSFDAALRAGELPLSQTGALRRTGPGASWSEVEPDEVWSAPYDFLLYRANGLLLAFVER
jgi:SAM-dependent methyltransferase